MNLDYALKTGLQREPKSGTCKTTKVSNQKSAPDSNQNTDVDASYISKYCLFNT